jgi:transmembrane sensor
MKKPDFVEALRRADAELEGRDLSAPAQRRLAAALEARPRPVTRWLVAAAVASVLALGVGVWRWPAEPLPGFTLALASPDARYLSSGESLALSAGKLELRGEGLTLWLEGAAAVERRGADSVAVRAGRVGFSVAKRRGAFKVTVSHGVIEVLGTRFWVRQGEGGGEVRLEEGRIRFTQADGVASTLEAGETLVWPVPEPVPVPVTVPTSQDSGARAPAAAGPRAERPSDGGRSPDTSAVLAEVAELRSRRAYAQAVQRLRAALVKPLGPASRERLSWELGSILTYQLEDVAEACAHWERHRRTFSEGAYEVEVRQAMSHLQCAPSSSP